jgi:hypothetical protein
MLYNKDRYRPSKEFCEFVPGFQKKNFAMNSLLLPNEESETCYGDGSLGGEYSKELTRPNLQLLPGARMSIEKLH